MLKLYENIKRKRIELGMSQQKLAELTGYADRSMICKIEKGVVDIPQSKVVEFARALNTTPGDLIGSTEEYVVDLLVENFKALNDEGRGRLIEYLSFLTSAGYAK